MSLRDMRGNPVSAATPAALAHYEQATDLSLAFSGRAADAADAAVAADPGFVMGHCLKARTPRSPTKRPSSRSSGPPWRRPSASPATRTGASARTSPRCARS